MLRPTAFGTAALLLLPSLAFAHVGPGVAGTPKPYCEARVGDMDTHDYAPPALEKVVGAPLDGNAEDCDGDGGLDSDGHLDFAVGGAFLLACDARCGDGSGDGARACYGMDADHRTAPLVRVVDEALGEGALFTVSADLVDLAAPMPGVPRCGDFEADATQRCLGACVVPFRPGLDGAYVVYVQGTAGHVVVG